MERSDKLGKVKTGLYNNTDSKEIWDDKRWDETEEAFSATRLIAWLSRGNHVVIQTTSSRGCHVSLSLSSSTGVSGVSDYPKSARSGLGQQVFQYENVFQSTFPPKGIFSSLQAQLGKQGTLGKQGNLGMTRSSLHRNL